MTSALRLAAPVLAGAARVVLGVLWLGEGLFKYRAGFGEADILLVADSTAASTRAPEYYQWFAETFLAGAPALFGFGVPLIEVGLGAVLVLGVLSAPAAWMSVLMLMSYWLSDKLVDPYPIMVALAVVVAAFPIAASRIGVTEAVDRLRRRREGARSVPRMLRRWL